MMSRTKTIVTVLLLLVAVGIGAILFQMNMAQKDQSQNQNTSDAPQSEVPPTVTPDTSTESAVTITYDGNSFTSSATTMKAGQSVEVVNTSNKQLDFDSDPHPVHTDNPELNAGNIGPGERITFIIAEKGTWGYHNHLNSSQKGSIKVE